MNVAIIEWDYHHVDGTQELVDPDVHLFSIHAYGPGIYPGTGGRAENRENVTNYPCVINSPNDNMKYNDNYYLNIFSKKIIPKLKKINVDFLLISNGLDAHKDDLLAGLNLTNQFYIEATRMFKELNVPVVYILEGGYNPEVIRNVSKDIIDELLI